MMNSENMWFMVYLLPQISCQMPYNIQIINPITVFPLEKVETKKNQKQKQEIIIKKSVNETNEAPQGSKYGDYNKQYQKQDSSFFLPIKQQYKTSEQKLGRNSASNILRLFTKMLKNLTFKQKYMKLKEKLGIEINFKEFNSWLAGIGLNMNKYIRMKKILNGIRTKPKFGRILCILYTIFQNEYARSAALTSSKTQSKNKLPTLMQIRNIKEQIHQAFQEGIKLQK